MWCHDQKHHKQYQHLSCYQVAFPRKNETWLGAELSPADNISPMNILKKVHGRPKIIKNRQRILAQLHADVVFCHVMWKTGQESGHYTSAGHGIGIYATRAVLCLLHMFDLMIRTSLVGVSVPQVLPQTCPGRLWDIQPTAGDPFVRWAGHGHAMWNLLSTKAHLLRAPVGPTKHTKLLYCEEKWRSLVLSTYYRDVGGMGHQPVPTSRGTGLATVTVLEPRAPQHGPKCRAFSLLSRLRCDLGSLSARSILENQPCER